MEEIFKTIIDHTRYEVSNFGRVRNINTQKFVNAHPVTKGYLSLVLYRDSENRKIPIKLHRVVAENFLTKKEENYVLDHIDNDKTNNKSSNLQYVSNRYNIVKQKLFSEKGFVRKNKRNKTLSFTIEYRPPGNKRTSFTSNILQDCLIHYCNVMDNIDSSVSDLVRNHFNLQDNTERE